MLNGYTMLISCAAVIEEPHAEQTAVARTEEISAAEPNGHGIWSVSRRADEEPGSSRIWSVEKSSAAEPNGHGIWSVERRADEEPGSSRIWSVEKSSAAEPNGHGIWSVERRADEEPGSPRIWSVENRVPWAAKARRANYPTPRPWSPEA